MFIYGSMNMIQKSISILLIPLYLKTLSIQEYGTLEIIIAVFAFFSHLFMLQMDGGFQRFFYENKSPKKIKLYFSSHLYFIGFVNLLGAILFYLLYDFIIYNIFSGRLIPKIIFALLGLNLFSRNITNLLLTALRFNNKKFWFGFSVITDTIITTVTSVILLVFYEMGIKGIYIAQVCGSVFSNLVMLLVMRNDLVCNFDFKTIKPSIKFSSLLVPGVIIGWSLSHYSRIFMSTSGISFQDIAVYGIAFKFCMLIILGTNALKLVWQPVSINFTSYWNFCI